MRNKIKILLVDDDPHFLRAICKLLGRNGYELTPVGSGEEALAAARRNKFDIAVVDLEMPGMHGEQVLEALKKEHLSIQVIILTGHGALDSAVRSARLGVFRYLDKPCEPEELMHALDEAYANTKP